MHTGLKEPHVLLAAANPKKLIRNLAGILNPRELAKIDAEVDQNVVALFRLGENHLSFALRVAITDWRQKVSRFYYAAYNAKRAVSLKNDGSFSTDSTDHQKIDQLPDGLTNAATYKTKLKNLRDDRNLADYSHLAAVSDLILPLSDAQTTVVDFFADTRMFLESKGMKL